MLYLDKVNPSDRPGVTVPELVDDLAAKGAKLIIAGSDDMKDGILEAARQHPELTFIHVSGDDVLLSGLDTPEALSVAEARRKAGKQVFAVPYNYKNACQGAEDTCLGVPYFNWGPPFLAVVKAAAAGRYTPAFTWLPPDYAALNDPTKSPVGFVAGGGLTAPAKKALAGFESGLASGAVDLYAGPLAYQNGATFVPAGRTATERELWFCPQLLRGMDGASAAK